MNYSESRIKFLVLDVVEYPHNNIEIAFLKWLKLFLYTHRIIEASLIFNSFILRTTFEMFGPLIRCDKNMGLMLGHLWRGVNVFSISWFLHFKLHFIAVCEIESAVVSFGICLDLNAFCIIGVVSLSLWFLMSSIDLRQLYWYFKELSHSCCPAREPFV